MFKERLTRLFQARFLLLSLIISAMCLLSNYCGYLFAKTLHNEMVGISGLWAVISSILVFEANYQNTIKASIHRIKGSILGALIAGLFFTVLGINHWVWFLACMTIVLLAHIIGMKDDIKLGLLTCALIFIIQLYHGTSLIWENCFQRCIESIIGILVAVILNSVYNLLIKHSQQAS